MSGGADSTVAPGTTHHRRAPPVTIRKKRPTVSDDVFERFKAGDSLDTLVAEYARSTEEIQEAIRYEADRAA